MRKLLATLGVVAVLTGVAPVLSHARDAAPATRARLAPELAASLETAAPDAGILVFVHGTTPAAARSGIDDAGLTSVGEFRSVGVPVAVGTAAQIRALAGEPGISYIEANRAISPLLDTARAATRADEAGQLTFQTDCQTTTTDGTGNGRGNRGKGKGNQPPTETTTCTEVGPFEGAGQTIAIVDGGVDGTHPMFADPADPTKSRVVRNLKVACFNNIPGITFAGFLGTDPATCPASYTGNGEDNEPFMVDMTAVNDTDSNSAGGHGTHVAGIAAGGPVTTSDGVALQGLAPRAKVVALSMGLGIGIYGADAALDWVARHHADPCGDGSCPPITVVNNSYGSGGDWDPESVTTKIQQRLIDQGVSMVWANGNGDLTGDGGDGSDNRSGSDAAAQIPGVIAVANYNDNNSGTRDGALAPSSSRGRATDPATWPDVSAPGTDITSACRPYLAICTSGEADSNYGTIGGTSMAAPHVAGVIALVREANPDLTPAQVELLLEDTAYKFQFGAPYWLVGTSDNPDSGASFDKGHGLIDVVAALAAATGAVAPAPGSSQCIADPLIVDESGDATRASANTPLPSEPRVDVVSGNLAWDGSAVTFTIGVHDLTPGNPDGTTGIAFDFNFAHAGTDYFILAERNGETASAYLGHFETTRTEDVVVPVTFDDESDTITIVVSNELLAGTAVPPFADGDQFQGLNIVSRRAFTVPGAGVGLILDADDAFAACPFNLGAQAGEEPAPGPAPQPFPEGGGETPPPTTVDATLTDGQTFSASGFSPTDNGGGIPGIDAGYTCTGPGDPRCVTYTLDLQPAEGSGVVDIVLTSDEVGTVADDFDWYVYDSAGTEIAAQGNPQTIAEVNVVPIDAPGIYFVVVTPYSATTESPFTIDVTLNRF